MAKILLIDDDGVTLKFLNQILTAQGFVCREEIDSRKALDSIHEFHPDLIVVDFLMPYVSGVQVCRQIKEDAAAKNIPVIFVAGSTEASTKVMALEAGAVDYLSKPVNPKELAMRIRIHLDLAAGKQNSA